jgi:hypothetical protein
MQGPSALILMIDNQQRIRETCDQIKELLLSKNKKYGDSALNPTRIFSKLDQVEQLYVRIDDKLSRISKGAGLLANDEDVINDLIGYLVLLKIALKDKNERWDGSDIEPPCSVFKKVGKLDGLSDTEWLEYYASGDRFA